MNRENLTSPKFLCQLFLTWKFPDLWWLYIEVSSAFWDHLQGQTMAGQPDKIEDLGETHIPQEIFTEYLFDLMPQFSYVPLFSSPSSFLFLLHSFPSFPLSSSFFFPPFFSFPPLLLPLLLLLLNLQTCLHSRSRVFVMFITENIFHSSYLGISLCKKTLWNCTYNSVP